MYYYRCISHSTKVVVVVDVVFGTPCTIVVVVCSIVHTIVLVVVAVVVMSCPITVIGGDKLMVLANCSHLQPAPSFCHVSCVTGVTIRQK